jgi:hypothetical protein
MASFSAWQHDVSGTVNDYDMYKMISHFKREDVLVFQLLPRISESGMIVIHDESKAIIELLLW